MKLAMFTNEELIEAYIKKEFPGSAVLLICGMEAPSQSEVESFYEDLKAYYLNPPAPIPTYDWCCIELKETQVPYVEKLLDQYSGGTLILSLWENGEKIKEN